jgi:hypothetical protein
MFIIADNLKFCVKTRKEISFIIIIFYFRGFRENDPQVTVLMAMYFPDRAELQMSQEAHIPVSL